MADYFDEHNCVPLRNGETPDHLLHYARMLIDTGVAEQIEMEFTRLRADYVLPPPTSTKFIEALPTVPAEEQEGINCPVCLSELENVCLRLPCGHCYHKHCIVPWLQRTNSCPTCRHEMPTDDADYETHKKQKERRKVREQELESLHDSMYG